MTSVIIFGILKVLLIIVVLVAIVVLIMGIGIVSHRMEDTDNHATAEMRHDLDHKEEVIGRHSVFRDFLLNSRGSRRHS